MGSIVIAGGHGQIARHLYPLLTQRGHTARGLIRNPDQAATLEALGAEAIICDMEHVEDLSPYVHGADAVVFAAGAGPGSGAERKQTVDLGAAVKLIRACMTTGVSRYVMISAINAAEPEKATEEMRPYAWAKAEADTALENAGLADTIIRPGRLTDDPPKGFISAGPEIERAEISRADVAAVVAACLDLDHTIHKTFNVVSGVVGIEKALLAL